MPELPEVESTVRYLQERVVGLEIKSAQVFWPRTVHPISLADFTNRLQAMRVCEVTRRGKFICMRIASRKDKARALYWFCHLRMSGNLDVVTSSLPVDKHDRMILTFSNGKDLRFNDPRKFGRVYLVSDPERVVADLGIEPLSPEFTAAKLKSILETRAGAIKPLLLNQKIISGIGNIYADESLWRAHIHPSTPARRLSHARVLALHRAIQAVLKEAIRYQGTDSGDGVVTYGSYRTRVYGREGAPCPRCAKKIRRIVVGQRGTHFCVSCQVLRSQLK